MEDRNLFPEWSYLSLNVTSSNSGFKWSNNSLKLSVLKSNFVQFFEIAFPNFSFFESSSWKEIFELVNLLLFLSQQTLNSLVLNVQIRQNFGWFLQTNMGIFLEFIEYSHNSSKLILGGWIESQNYLPYLLQISFKCCFILFVPSKAFKSFFCDRGRFFNLNIRIVDKFSHEESFL